MQRNQPSQNIIFFDGVCGLCNGFVDFVIARDKNNFFYFSPLQSDFAQKNLPAEFVNDLKTIVVRVDGQVYKKSRAVLKVTHLLGGLWKILTLANILPTSLLDFFYDLIATNRYKLFGKKETCRLPTPEERIRFLT
jgi:predicted DCC family thiol-disulfide oxidoreductase YuxK